MADAQRIRVWLDPPAHTNFDQHRLMVLYEENRTRPRGEILFNQLRSTDQGDDQLIDTISIDGVRKLSGRWRQSFSFHRFVSTGISESVAQRIAEVRRLLRVLSQRERKVLRLSLKGLPQEKIAAKLGVSRLRVRQIYAQAILKIRASYASKFDVLRHISPAGRA